MPLMVYLLFIFTSPIKVKFVRWTDVYMLIVFLELLETEGDCIYLLNQGNGKSVIVSI